MLNITIDAPRAFTNLELQILAASFEKMSQLATMYADANLTKPMDECVTIKKDDIDLTDVVDKDGVPVMYTPEFGAHDFLQALHLALHTMVSFSIDTKFGKKTVTSSLFPCILSYSGYVAWRKEPEFIIRLDENDRIHFEFFDELLELIQQDVDYDATKTTMIIGGNEVWSM